MVDLNEGDFIIVIEKDGFTKIRGHIIKKETKMLDETQFIDLILDSGHRIRKILYPK